MNNWAPRCREALSPRSVPECSSAGPLPAAMAANAVADSTRPLANAARRDLKVLVMRRHPFRHRLGLLEAEVRVHPQESEVAEVQHRQDAADVGLDDVGTRAGADLAQPDEADGEDGEGDLEAQAPVTDRPDLAAVQPRHEAQQAERREHRPDAADAAG